MENLIIEPTATTPQILFNTENGILDLRGRSSPDNSPGFYSRIVDYLDKYFEGAPAPKFIMNVNLEYFNTSSLKCIFQMLKKLADIDSSGTASVEINWYYEEDDDDMLETGEDICNLLNIGFNFISDKEVTN
jgi:hypothetical protein